MFALRNIGDREAVLALAKGFEDESALFRCVLSVTHRQMLVHIVRMLTLLFCLLHRHEIAFVFGQLSSPDSVPSLIDVLRRPHEEDMVRHEAAEALGGIATDECLPILKEFAQREDVPRVVRESCVVALDMVSVGSHLYRIDLIALHSRAQSGVWPAARETDHLPLPQYEYERSNEFVPLPTLPTATASA